MANRLTNFISKIGNWSTINLPFFFVILILTAIPTCLKLTYDGTFHFAKIWLIFGILGSIWIAAILTFLASINRVIRVIILLVTSFLTFVEFFVFINFKTRVSVRIIFLFYQTNAEEASEFITHYVFTFSSLCITLCIITAIVIIIILSRKLRKTLYRLNNKLFLGLLFLISTILSLSLSASSIYLSSPLLNEFIAYPTYLQILDALTVYKSHSHDLSQLELTSENADGTICHEEDAPELIIWIIGESFNKYHSPFYGYPLNTQPLLRECDKESVLIFDKASTLSASTAEVLQSLYSTNDLDFEQNPLAITLIHNAGYKVTLLDNQVTSIIGDPKWDNQNMWFLNSSKISTLSLDYRNSELQPFDLDFVRTEINNIVTGEHSLAIFHLKGQHGLAKYRYPENFSRFTVDDYQYRLDLDNKQKQTVAYYDNATVYNDSVIATILAATKNKDAIVVYHSDHGEEIHDYRNQYGRTLEPITPNIFRYVYEVPFFIYTTPKYRIKHAKTYERIIRATNRPVSISDISHSLLDIAAVHSRYYNPERSIFSPSYQPPETVLK